MYITTGKTSVRYLPGILIKSFNCKYIFISLSVVGSTLLSRCSCAERERESCLCVYSYHWIVATFL